MRRGLPYLLITGLILVALAPPAGARPAGRRVIEKPYRTPVPGATLGPGNKAYYYDCQNEIGCAIIPLKTTDRYGAIEIEDTAGQKVFFSIYLMPGGSHIGDFCGSTGGAISTRRAQEFLVHVVSGVCDDGSTVSVATTGIVKATLSKKHF